MSRIAPTLDDRGRTVRICADEEAEACIVCPNVPHDRVYHWSSLKVGRKHVEEKIGGWPAGDKEHVPFTH